MSDGSTHARVMNNSRRPLLVGVPTQDGYDYYRLSPGCSSPLTAAAKIVCAAERDVAIARVRAWRLDGPVVAYITDEGNQLEIACSACTPLDDAPAGQLVPLDNAAEWCVRPGDVWVTVLGGGITGLSAAHELAARGIRVQIIDKNHQSPPDSQAGGHARLPRVRPSGGPGLSSGLTSPDVGGIARTQWATMPHTRSQAPSPPTPRTGRAPLSLKAVHSADWYGPQPTGRDDDRDLRVPFAGSKLAAAAFLERFRDWYQRLQDQDRALVGIQLAMIVYIARDGRDGEPFGAAAAYARLAEFRSWLEGASVEAKRLNSTIARLAAFPVARLEVTVDEPPAGPDYPGLLLRHHEHLGLIAGEHGFRFFPGFYRHLRDTMRRTPIFDSERGRFTSRTVHDNLSQVPWQVIVDPQRKHAGAFARRSFPTAGALFDQYRSLRQDLGYRPSDLMRFLLRVGRYMTSSSERRAQVYENLSWWDFLSVRDLRRSPGALGGEHGVERLSYGVRFAAALRHSPLALVAMKAETCDARTQGNIAVQLGMSQFNLHDWTDSTLNGPTSDSWFAHWRRYLELQGVGFFVGEVTGISSERVAADRGLRARAEIAFPDGQPPVDFIDAESIALRDLENARDDVSRIRHYYLCALDAPALERCTRPLRAAPQLRYGGVVSSLNRLLADAEEIEDITRVGEGELSRFQTLTGIQLYYRPRIAFADGHIYFAESAWGLSAVSQVQYWASAGAGERSQFLSNLSVDIGCWRAAEPASPSEARHPNQLSRDEIAAEVLAQIAGEPWQGSQADFSEYYHLDDYIQFGFSRADDGLRPMWNRSPFLVNLVGEWQLRPPGEPWAPRSRASRGRVPGRGGFLEGEGVFVRGDAVTPVWQHEQGGYLIHHGNLVFAGTHMRTFTRMGTMEAANESARHAVNALLDHLAFEEPELQAQFGVERERASAGPFRMPTKYGDYCDIWDPEDNEIPDLDFLRIVDKHLMAAEAEKREQADDLDPQRAAEAQVAPHLFDLLRVDELPDLMDGDGDALRIFELIESGFRAFGELGRHDVPSALAIVDQLRRKVEQLIGQLGAARKR